MIDSESGMCKRAKGTTDPTTAACSDRWMTQQFLLTRLWLLSVFQPPTRGRALDIIILQKLRLVEEVTIASMGCTNKEKMLWATANIVLHSISMTTLDPD